MGEMPLVEAGTLLADVSGAALLWGATHWVQIVDVLVLMMVEIVVVVWRLVLLPDVIVLVTGQVVSVVTTISVVTIA